MSTETCPTMELGTKIADLCRAGENIKAVETLYHDDVVSVEAMGDADMDREMRGKEAVLGKNRWWRENHEVHSAKAEGPFPHGDRFAMYFEYEVTPKAGPMEGNRFTMREVALYTERDGKVGREEFFYSMG